MDFSQIQHGNVQINGLLSNPEFSDLLGEDFKQQYTRYNPKEDAKLLVRFFSGAVLLGYATEQLRKPKVIQSDFIAIRLDEYTEHIAEVGWERDPFGKPILVGGERVPTPLREEYLTRFPRAWEQYERQFHKSEGTPLSQLPGCSLSDIAELGVYKIGTVEALADASDRLFIPMGANPPFLDKREDGGTYFELREKARQYVKENGEFESVVKAKAAAEAEAAELRAMVEKLKSELAASGPVDAEKVAIHNEQLARDERQAALAKAERRK